MTVPQASILSTTTSITEISFQASAYKHCKKAQGCSFDALLDMVDSSSNAAKEASASSYASATAGANSLVSSIFSVFMSENSAEGGFGFSDDFVSAFGASGPLIDFINAVTKGLHLTKEQNQALQDISIKHKYDAGTPGATEAIAAELAAAGIGQPVA